jgi:hypothetical protein
VAAADYFAAVVAVAATLLAAVAAGLLAGALLRPRAAMLVTVAAGVAVAAITVVAPEAGRWLPGGAFVLLAGAAGPDPVAADALRAAGIGLALAAVVLVVCRVAFERSDL